MKNLFKNLLIFFIVFLTIAALFSLYQSEQKNQQEIDISRMIQYINNEEAKTIEISGDQISLALGDGSLVKTRKETGESFSDLVKNYNVPAEKIAKVKVEIVEESGGQFVLKTILPFLLPFLFIAVFIYIMMRQVQGANNRAMMFGKSSAREMPKDNNKDKATFKDVAGIKEAKEELGEVIDFLKNSQKFTNLGAKIPKGVLLVGPPGTGKTLVARAVAGEANVPFFHMSGSEFVEMFVGVGASRVRDLFHKAKKNAPCIVFIDELDAVGRQRGAGLGGSHDEREQTLNQILVEMDGFEINSGVIILAATNRPDVLDPALLRPGRFDRTVIIDLPDLNDREAILKVHARKKPLAANVSLRTIAERTPGLSGADLANVLNESAILAARRNKTIIETDELLESLEKVMIGPERKSHILSKKEKKITAYHEAGHALVAHLLPNSDPVHKISIVSRGMAAGYTLKLPMEDKHLHSRGEFIDDLAVLLAGYAAEKEFFKEITTGASNDLKRATQLAKRLITEFGMSDALGPRTFGKKEELIFLGREIHEQRDYSEKVAEKIDAEVSRLIKQALGTAAKLIKDKKEKMEKVATTLLEKETIEREEFEKLMAEKEGATPKSNKTKDSAGP